MLQSMGLQRVGHNLEINSNNLLRTSCSSAPYHHTEDPASSQSLGTRNKICLTLTFSLIFHIEQCIHQHPLCGPKPGVCIRSDPWHSLCLCASTVIMAPLSFESLLLMAANGALVKRMHPQCRDNPWILASLDP